MPYIFLEGHHCEHYEVTEQEWPVDGQIEYLKHRCQYRHHRPQRDLLPQRDLIHGSK